MEPIEPANLTFDLAKAAGPYKAGTQKFELPEYRRYVGEFIELAKTLRGENTPSLTLNLELQVQEALLRACEMM